MKLDDIRRQIDKIDRELLVLLHERMGLALRSRKFKEKVADPDREAAVLAKAERLNLDLVEASFSRQLLKTIIEESKRLQGEERKLVGFQGENGAYSEVAARRLAPGAAYAPCLEFSDVFSGVEDGSFDLGVVPVENSLEGTVTQVNDLLATTELKIIGESNLPVHHCLLGLEPLDYREIQGVYSHPQALAQCRGFLARHNLKARPYYDTAGAAKMLALEQPKAAAAIASALCAELYDLEILAEGIEDHEANQTRFLLISRRGLDREGDKCSIVFAVLHRPGALYQALRLFAEAGINLTRIASIPRRTDPGNYTFFLDFEGSERSEVAKGVLAEMEKQTTWMKILGSYPSDS